MSVGVSAEPQAAGSSEWVERRATTSLVVSVVLLVLVCLLVLSGFLVKLDSDRNGKALLPGAVAGSGSVAGDLSLTNSGLLPIQVTLEPRTADDRVPSAIRGKLDISIQRLDGGEMLYDGPLKDSMGPLLMLGFGETARLRVIVSSADVNASAAIPLTYTWHWNARASLPWWWWVPVALVVVALLAYAWWRPRRGKAPA